MTRIVPDSIPDYFLGRNSWNYLWNGRRPSFQGTGGHPGGLFDFQGRGNGRPSRQCDPGTQGWGSCAGQLAAEVQKCLALAAVALERATLAQKAVAAPGIQPGAERCRPGFVLAVPCRSVHVVLDAFIVNVEDRVLAKSAAVGEHKWANIAHEAGADRRMRG